MRYLSVLLAVAAIAQAEMSICGTEELLPIGFTEEELTRLDEIGVNTVPTSPPPSGTVNPAEFDPATGVMVRWPLGVSWELVVDISMDSQLWVICTAGQQPTAEYSLDAVGCDMDNVGFITASTNSVWVRDYGPWFVMLPDGSQGIFNYTYNRPRPLDNLIPQVIGDAWDIPVYTSTIEHSGGNYMSSGTGQAMSTTLVYNENSGDEEWVDGQMESYLGITEYLTYVDPIQTYLEHIDCWSKILGPSRIMVLQVPPGHPHYAAVEATADLIAATDSPYGIPWEVHRVYSSGTEGYTNSLISEDVVYLPVWDTDNDSGAFAAYVDALPGYTVKAYPHSAWQNTDALHCRTRNVMDNEMLLIEHIPVGSIQAAGAPVSITARIRCHPDNSLTTTEVLYRAGVSGPFTSVSMTSAGADSFSADIPGYPDGEDLQYYIHAADDSGRDEARPRFAPGTWFFEYETSSTGIGGTASGHRDFTVLGVSPNPFAGFARIDYACDGERMVNFTVHDLSGRVLESLDVQAEAGTGTVQWSAGPELPNGVYIIRGTSGETVSRMTVTLVR